jgi:hypothetical protein
MKKLFTVIALVTTLGLAGCGTAAMSVPTTPAPTVTVTPEDSGPATHDEWVDDNYTEYEKVGDHLAKGIKALEQGDWYTFGVHSTAAGNGILGMSDHPDPVVNRKFTQSGRELVRAGEAAMQGDYPAATYHMGRANDLLTSALDYAGISPAGYTA